MSAYLDAVNENRVQYGPFAMNDDLVERYGWLNVPITLDGKQAFISGIHMRFAVIHECLNPCKRCEFAWSTVKHVIATKEGKFKT